MTKPIIVIVLTSAVVIPAELRAQAPDNSERDRPHGVEVTPYVSLGSEASSGLGTAVRWPLGARFSIELETEHRRAETNGFLSNVSVMYDLPSCGRLTPYVVAGIGIEPYSFAYQSPFGGVATSAGTAVAVNAGGGVRVVGGSNWGMRTDARWSNGIGWRAPERVRLYNGVTFTSGR